MLTLTRTKNLAVGVANAAREEKIHDSKKHSGNKCATHIKNSLCAQRRCQSHIGIQNEFTVCAQEIQKTKELPM